jgi:DNA mismatch repair protein MutL
MFIIAEGPDGLYLIDQHAAHERVLYERMVSEETRGQIRTQTLLEPAVISLPADAAVRLEELLPTINQLGLQIESFGPNTFRIRALPAHLTGVSPSDLLVDIASSLEGDSTVDDEREEALIRQICKRAAVKAGQVLSPDEMKQLIRDLEQTINPRTCPHGRPTIIQISTETLARQFGRI